MLIHAFIEGFKNILQEKRISATAVVIIYISIMSICLIGAIWTFFSYGIRVLDREVQIVAFVEKGVNQDQKTKLVDDIKKFDGVKKVELFDNNAGKNQILLQNTFRDTFKQNLEKTNSDIANFDYIVVYPVNSEKYNLVYNQVNDPTFKSGKIYERVPNMLETVSVLKSIYRGVQIFGVILIIVFAIISTLVMANIFQIMIFHHKNEIEIQRLVGATNNYIRSPFIAQGIIYYLFSSVLAVLSIFPLLNYVLPFIGNFINNTDASKELINTTYVGVLSILLFGFVFGILTTYVSIERYLKN
jgi:cell division transport system permease protein